MQRLSVLWSYVPQTAAVAALLAALFWLATGGEAAAHAHYAHSQPSIGQVLPAAPAEVDIYTDSDMRKQAGSNVITVTGPDGSEADNGNTVVDDSNPQHFSVGLNPNLPNGRYVVAFKTLSDVDGDTDGGKFTFYVGAGPTDAQKAQDASLNGPPVTIAAQSSSSGGGHSEIPLILGGGAIAVVLVAGCGIILMRRRAA